MAATKALRVLFSCILLAVSAGSGAAADSPISSGQPPDLFPHKARLRFASGFTMGYHGTYKRLDVLTPWRNAENSFVFILVPRGQAAPPDLPRGAFVVPIPLKRIAVFSITWTAFFPMLKIEDTLAGICGCEWVSTPEIVSLIRQGQIAEIGDGGRGMNRHIHMERLALLRPEAVMVYGTGIPEFDQHPKLIDAGFIPLVNASHMEPTPLGRAEWIKYIAAFFDREAEAERIFDDVVLRYEALAEKTRNVSRRPTVFCAAAWRGTWYMPGGGSYVARFLEDAGADYLWRDNESRGSIPLSIEAVVQRAREAEFWIDVGTCRSLAELRGVDDRYGLFSAFRAGKVFNNDAKSTPEGGNDFWETGIARPDLVLADLIGIFHPELMPDHRLIWYRQMPPQTTEGQK